MLGVLDIGFSVGEEILDEVPSLEGVMRLFGHWASLGLLDFPFRTTAEGRYAPVLVDVEAVTSTCSGSRVHWAHTVVLVVAAAVAAAASLMAHHIYSEIVGVDAAVEGAVANICHAVFEAWTAVVHEALVALGEEQELGSIRLVKARKWTPHVLRVAIQLEVEVRVEELAARAHFAAAAAVSIAQAALSRKRRARLLGSRRELTSTQKSATIDVLNARLIHGLQSA